MSYFSYYPPSYAQPILPHAAPLTTAPTLTPAPTPSHSPSHHTPLDLIYPSFTLPPMGNESLQAEQALAAQRNLGQPLPPGVLFPMTQHSVYYHPYIPAPEPLHNEVIPLSAVSTIPSPVDSVSSLSASPSDISSTAPEPQVTRTNWAPTLLPSDPNISHPSTTPLDDEPATRKVHPPPNGDKPPAQPLLSRSRRAAASKARSKINKYTSTLLSPIATPSIGTSTSRPSSRASSHAQSRAEPGHTRTNVSASGDGSSGITIVLPHPAGPKYTKKASGGGTTVRLTGCRPDGQLLAAPPGSLLEVNDLLILHPPAVSPSRAGPSPMNQYSQAPCPDGYKSAYEMYTCRVCAKTYDGKNARSVARRHLQDKHSVPLALQERRTRWDGDSDRPKNEAEVKERCLKSKRDWAARARQHVRLERLHSAFLEKYGQKGICTPCKTHMIAPALRVTTVSCVENPLVAKHHLEWREIPKSLRDAVAEMNGNPIPIVAPEDEVYDETYESGGIPGYDVPYEQKDKVPELIPRSNVGLRKKALTKRRVKSASFSGSSLSSASTQSAVSESLPMSPVQMVRSFSAFGTAESPVSHTRTASTGRIGMPTGHDGLNLTTDWDSTWGAATHVNERTLEIAMAQHYQGVAEMPEGPAVGSLGAPLRHAIGSEASVESPTPVYPIGNVQQWSQVEHSWSQPQPFFTAETPSAWMQNQGVMSGLPVEEGYDDSAEHEAAVAESLLNLHSTPARPDDTVHLARLTSTTEMVTSSDEATQTASSAIRGLLDAPDITPRPARPARARSFIQPFNKGRESMTRSLSFTENHADDPFAFTPSSPVLSSKKRKSAVASPSPLAVKKRKNDSPLRLPMSTLRPNAAATSQYTSNNQQIFYPDNSILPATFIGGAFTTPIRPTKVGVPASAMPSSLSKVWQFSSPGDPGAAASLGLVPQWGIGTPGMSGMVGSDTPGMTR